MASTVVATFFPDLGSPLKHTNVLADQPISIVLQCTQPADHDVKVQEAALHVVWVECLQLTKASPEPRRVGRPERFSYCSPAYNANYTP